MTWIRSLSIATLGALLWPSLAEANAVERVCLQSADAGRYVAAEPSNNYKDLRANRTWCREWEQFLIRRVTGEGVLRHGERVSIQTHWGRLWIAQPDRVLFHRGDPFVSDRELFTIERLAGAGVVEDGDLIALRDYRGRFVRRLRNSAENGRLNMHETPDLDTPPWPARFSYELVEPRQPPDDGDGGSGGGGGGAAPLPPTPVPPPLETVCQGSDIPTGRVVVDDRYSQNCAAGYEFVLRDITEAEPGDRLVVCIQFGTPPRWRTVFNFVSSSRCRVQLYDVVGSPEGTPNVKIIVRN